MGIEEFLELFIKELEINSDLRNYYRLLNNKGRYLWRKAYLEQRLRYVSDNLKIKEGNIWDVGCGYATTAIFLALNGHRVMGNTLEFYFDKISNRFDYWSRYGSLSNLKVEYANLFDMPLTPQFYDTIIAQDTLHHLEPINEALQILSDSLKSGGRLIVTEENGNNLFINLKNFSRRGFKKVTWCYDEKLQKTILFGNENARGMHTWRHMLEASGLEVPSDPIEYIRYYPPFCFTEDNNLMISEKEKQIGSKVSLIRELLFFGINFTAIKPNH
jgi:SAM-dependent methyltransferase